MASEYDKLHEKSIYIRPYTMPTVEMLKEVGIPDNNQVAIDRYRNSNMMTMAWCAIHDAAVKILLDEAGWLGDQPVSNVGKHWCRNRVIYGWWLENGGVIQSPSKFHFNEPTYVDYATTFHVVRGYEGHKKNEMKGSGVDISKWQDPDNINYEQLAKDHDFLVARASYGVKPDPTFRVHFTRGRDAGLKVGGYLFYRQTQDWEDQFDTFVSELNSVNFRDGNVLPVVDLEENQRWDGPLVKESHNEDARRIIEKLKEKYGDCYVYLAPFHFVNLGEPKWLLDYPWWIAHYTKAKKPKCPWKDWDIWQYTGKGKTPGYNGKTIDLNRVLTLRLVGGKVLK
jgi:GH25 family lysozyme M1 (1,4-beta-N-acetylmuramidase)